MKSFLRLLPLLVAAVFAAPLPALQAADAPTAKTYKVNLSPAFKVGQKFTVVTDSTQSDVANIALTPAGAAPQVQNQKQQVAAHLEAEAEVLAIFPHGGSQKLALTVKVLTATANGQPVPNLPGAGAKITAERVGKDKNFTVDGKPADATQAKFLGMVINPDNEKHIDQDIFGTATPQPVGGTWPLNAALAADSLKDEIGLDVGQVSGSFKLDSATGTGDDQVLSVSGTFSVTDVKLPMPPGVATDSAAMTGQMTSQLPASTTKGTLKQQISMSMKGAAHGGNPAMQIKVDMGSEMKLSSTLTFH